MSGGKDTAKNIVDVTDIGTYWNIRLNLNLGEREKMMTRNLILIGIVTAMLLIANLTLAGSCEIVNGSFEADGRIDNVAQQDPNGWIAEIPSEGQFTAKTDASWSTEGNWSLNISSQWFITFAAGDMAKVSQQISLTDIDEIIFDVRLNTYTGAKWDPNIATVFIMIDDDLVWEPNNTVSNLSGEYLDQSYAVEDKYRDGNLHTLSFGLRINVDAPNGFFEFYRTWWDNIECGLFCNGGGFLDGDFNRDCYVDISDIKLMAELWLAELPASDRFNLASDDDVDAIGFVNFLDFSVFADNWLFSSFLEEQQ